MKLLFFFIVTLSLMTESKYSALGQDDRKEDLLVQCMIGVVSKSGSMSLQPECKDILQKQGSSHALLAKKNEDKMIPMEKNEKSQERESNARVQEIIDLLKTNEEKRDDLEEERSQEEFPNYYKRHYILTSKEKREDPDNERSQEEFPQKRYSLLSTKEKRDYYDYERSQEEFPTYEHKRHVLLSSKEKRDDPDYDRSQEEFPSYVYKRYNDEDRGAEKQIWKPDKYYYKQYDEDFAPPNSQELEDRSAESEEKEKRVWKPGFRNHNTKLFYKQGKFENENDANPHHSLETSKHYSPEEEDEELIAQEINKNKQHYETQEEQKRDHSDAEERKQEKDAGLRYLTKKLKEHLLKDAEVFNKHNPSIYRGYHHPAWYKQTAERNEGPVGPSQKLEELANVLRFKMGLLPEKASNEMEKAYLPQRALTPEELKKLEKLASVEQRAQMN